MAAANNMVASWAGGEPHHQYAQPSNNTTETACSSPPDTPLVKIVQQHQGSVAGDPGIAAHPTPPLSASSHGLSHHHQSNGQHADPWRTYHAPAYQQGIHIPSHGAPASVPGSYAQPAFASPMQPGIPHAAALESHGSFEQQPAAADYYYGHAYGHAAHQQMPATHTPVPASVPSHHPGSMPEIHSLHYPASAGHPQPAAPGSALPQEAVHQFDHATGGAPANSHYVGDFAHNVYNGAEICSAPPTMHLPADPGSLPRHNSYFVTSQPSAFDPVAAAAAAAAASPYTPHPSAGPYMGRGPHPYPSPMVLNRFNLSISQGGGSPPAALSAPPPLTHSVSAGPAPARALGIARVSSQTSTSQRKRYLCQVCQKMFARPSTLNTHMHSHTGEKPYLCTWDSCGKQFSVMSNLRRHQRIHERQRTKMAEMHKQKQRQDDESTSGSTTPLAAQMPFGVEPVAAMAGFAHNAPNTPSSLGSPSAHVPQQYQMALTPDESLSAAVMAGHIDHGPQMLMLAQGPPSAATSSSNTLNPATPQNSSSQKEH